MTTNHLDDVRYSNPNYNITTAHGSGATIVPGTAFVDMTGEINVNQWDQMIVWVEYVEGNEDSFTIQPRYLRVTGGTEHGLNGDINDSATVAAQTFATKELNLAQSVNGAVKLDVNGVNIIKLYGKTTTTDGTLRRTGSVQLSYSLQNN